MLTLSCDCILAECVYIVTEVYDCSLRRTIDIIHETGLQTAHAIIYI